MVGWWGDQMAEVWDGRDNGMAAWRHGGMAA